MKRFFILLIILFSCNTYAATHYISADDGSDSNGGTSWVDSWLTLGKANGNVSAGDTVVCAPGTFTEQFDPTDSGSDGNFIIYIDSLRYNNYNIDYPLSDWSVIIDGEDTRNYCINLNGVSYIKFIGFKLIRANTALFYDQSNADDNVINQCKFEDLNDNDYMVIINGEVDVTSNLFLGNGVQAGALRIGGGGGNPVCDIINNTFYGDFTNEVIRMQDDAAVTIKFKNNIVVNTSATASDQLIEIDDQFIDDINYNCYFDTSTYTSPFRINSTDYSTFIGYRTAAQIFDGDAESNSFCSDPVLQDISTICTILPSSPCWNVGVDVGYGNKIGWWQGRPGQILSVIIQ